LGGKDLIFPAFFAFIPFPAKAQFKFLEFVSIGAIYMQIARGNSSHIHKGVFEEPMAPERYENEFVSG
jgi:hypothetical protein